MRNRRGDFWSLRPWLSPRDVAGWVEQTARWNTATLTRSPRRTLVELLDAVAGRFTGREVTVAVGPHAVRLRVEAVRVQARPDPNAVTDPLRWWAETSGMSELARWSQRRWSRGVVGRDGADDAPPVEAVEIDATDVFLDGLPVGRVGVHVDGVRLDAGVASAELVTGAIALDVRTTRAQVVEWLRRSRPEWEIESRPHGLVTLRMPPFGRREFGRRVRVLVRPALQGRVVRTDVLGIILRGRDVWFPRALVRTRVHPLPTLDSALELVDAREEGDDVALRFRHPGIRQRLRLDALRTAVVDGASKLTDAVFG